MKNKILVLASVIAVVLLMAGCSKAASTTTTTTTAAAQMTVNTSSTSTLGTFLVDGKGMTLYWTTRDAVGVSNIAGATLANWPVFYAATIMVPSSLSAANFSSITRADGTMQTTYKGWPLYYYINDKAAGDTKGQGLANVWFVVNPAASMPVASATTTTTTSATVTGPPVTINLTAQNIAFDKATISVPAGASVTINFNNTDSIPHNFAVYTDSNAATVIFQGQIVTGPATATYKFTAPSTPGTYFFRCDVHPTMMNGSFVVTP